MEFWKVAAGVLMFKVLDLLLAYGFTVMGDFSVEMIVIVLAGWLMISAGIWVFFAFVFGNKIERTIAHRKFEGE